MGIFFNPQHTHPGKLDMKSPPRNLSSLYILRGNTRSLDTLIVDGIAYNHSTIHKLPNDLTLEMAFTREYDDQIQAE